jgi:hypothetical protein
MRSRLIQIASFWFLLACSAFGQSTTITGTIDDLTLNPVTSGKVVFTLKPSVDTTISGNARFTPGQPVTCYIQSNGTLLNAAQTGACTVVSNTSLTPAGTSYRVDICPYMACSSSFNFYAINSTYSISSIVPTPTTGPAQNFADVFSNQTVAGNKTFTGNTVFGSASFTGITAQAVGNVAVADQFPGSDCGAKINNAITYLGGFPGEVWISNACGMSIATPINTGNYIALRFVQSGSWNQTATITLGTGASIRGLPSGLNEDVQSTPNPAVVLFQPGNTNLTNLIVLKGSNIDLRDFAIDGNARGGGNGSTTCVATDTSATGSGSRGRIHFDFLTVENCGLDNIDITSTLANNQALAFRMSNSSTNRSLGGYGLVISHSTDAHIFASQFELNSACGLESLDSVTFASFSDFSTNARCQILATVDGDTALAAFLSGGLSLVQNGITTTGLGSGLTENTYSSVIINGYNGSSCNVLTNTYVAFNTFAVQGGLQDNAISALRLMDTGSTTIIGNKIESSSSGSNRYKYGIDIGNVGSGCTQEFSDIVESNGYFANFGTGPYNYATSTDSECNGIGTAPGCTKARVTSCITAASANAACSTTVTWGVPLADANYTAVCTLDNPSFPSFVTFTSSKAAASLVVTIENAPGSTSATSGTLNCFARHD